MSLQSVALPGWPEPRPRVASYPRVADWGAGDEAVDLAASAGLVLDVWQQWSLRVALGAQPDGRWCSFETGLVVPRQNGKSAILEARELAGLFLFGEKLLIHTAHEFKTSQEAFTRIKLLVEGSDDLRRKVKRIRNANGEEGIELLNGARLRFLARSKGSGRGFSGDLVILDEAMFLPPGTMGALLPTMSARAGVTVGGPQLWYTASAGMEDSEVLAGVRARGIAGGEGLTYVEYAAGDPDDHEGKRVDLDDRREWLRANPAAHGPRPRITLSFIAKEREALTDEGEFAREVLCIWDRKHGQSVFDLDHWAGLAKRDSRLRDPVCFAVDIPPERGSATIAVAGHRRDGLGHVEVVQQRNGTKWAVGRLVELNAKWQPKAVLLDPTSPAGSLLSELQEAGIEPVLVAGREYAQACGDFYDSVVESLLAHLDQPSLNLAVDGARRRNMGDAWGWARRDTTVDISPLVACTLALHGVGKPSKRRVRTGEAMSI